jgi:flavin reductase (DIM6/NTAB) family NADH-FMN oxidoreductase RutF
MAAVNESAFRDALSRFASGVVVVTCQAPDGPVGFTVSAFSSVSLEPPLVLVCVAKTASAYDAIMKTSSFGISVLEAAQATLATQFARQGIDRFAGVALRPDTRVPLIEGAIATLECVRSAVHDAGDHTILVGAVTSARSAPGSPLLHYARTFGGFSPA